MRLSAALFALPALGVLSVVHAAAPRPVLKSTYAPLTRAVRRPLAAPRPAPRSIPALRWEKRSDWIDVTRDVTPPAVGDGKADDTDALQQGLDRVAASAHEGGPTTGDGTTLYLPPGVYRITRTLTLTGPMVGAAIVGSGSSTRLMWDGAAAGRMLHLNGVAYSRFVGMELDGRGKAAVGFYYNSDKRFQTEVTHRHLAFRGFTSAGVLNDPTRVFALAETTFENCLFEDCERGVAFPQFNDYDYTFDGCEFRRCGTGIECVHGNFYVRNCRFVGSRSVDISDASEHGSSVRRCSSTGSRAFLARNTSVAPVTIQDCSVDGWKNPAGAILLSRPPSLIFDCVFTHPPTDGRGRAAPPVHAASDGQRVMISGNRVQGGGALFASDTQPETYSIPADPRKTGAGTTLDNFLQERVRIPRRVFDARRDFGARGDGAADDTAAIQSAIRAAAAAGSDAMAYLPKGTYRVSRTLVISGHDYFVGGSGWSTRLLWKGAPGGVMMDVHATRRVTLMDMAVGAEDEAGSDSMDIRQSGSRDGSSVTYDGVYCYGMYRRQPFRKGLWFTGLGAKDVAVMQHVQGNLHFVNCARATILANCSYEGALVVEGKDRARGGILGFQTRLATGVTHDLYLRDSQSIVMSDFYVEQSDSGYLFEGSPGDPPGRATIQGAKVEFTVPAGDPNHNTAIEIHDYHGQIIFGSDQFYTEPKTMKIRQQGDSAVTLTLLGCSWYDSKPDVEMGTAGKLFRVGNEAYGTHAAQDTVGDEMTPGTIRSIGSALDDLRRLGDVDRRLNHPWRVGERYAAGR